MRGLKKSFGRKLVLDGIDLDVGVGESVVVIGGSGSGKSVMVKCILGLMEPDAGSIEIDGVEVDGSPHGRARAGDAEIRHAVPGRGLVRLACAYGRMSPSVSSRAAAWNAQHAKEIALEKLAAVGLGPEVGELRPAELSGGMQKRVALARAIAAEPEIIIFDEPTTGLDPIMADVINDLIVKCVHDLGATAISITHDMASTRKIADRVAMIYKGRIIWNGAVGDDGAIRQPLRRPVHPRPRRGADPDGGPRACDARPGA